MSGSQPRPVTIGSSLRGGCGLNHECVEDSCKGTCVKFGGWKPEITRKKLLNSNYKYKICFIAHFLYDFFLGINSNRCRCEQSYWRWSTIQPEICSPVWGVAPEEQNIYLGRAICYNCGSLISGWVFLASCFSLSGEWFRPSLIPRPFPCTSNFVLVQLIHNVPFPIIDVVYVGVFVILYAGDFRMFIGEDKDKIRNIIRPNVAEFERLYEPHLSSLVEKTADGRMKAVSVRWCS